MSTTRRQVLRRVAAGAGAGTAAVAAGTARSAAAPVPTFDPDGVAEADYPEELLKAYEPAVVSSPTARSELIGIYAWRATPTEAAETDLEALYYWYRYSRQRSLADRLFLGVFSSGGGTAHFLDHEPVIVFRDPSSGSVEAVVATGYHHLAAARAGESVPLTDSALQRPTHVRLRIVDPWHHFNFHDGSEPAALLSPRVGMESWLSQRRGWHANDVLAESSTEAVDDPFSMRDRVMWWDEDTRDARLAKAWVRWGQVGLGEFPSPTSADDDLRV